MVEYWKAEDDVVDLANEIIAVHHPHLIDARIAYLFRAPAAKRAGRTVWASARKASALLNALHDGDAYDFVVEIAWEEWGDMEPETQRALLDHELCHCAGTAAKGFRIVGHDFEDFLAIVKRHGAWTEALAETKTQLLSGEQGDLFRDVEAKVSFRLVGSDDDDDEQPSAAVAR